MKYISYLWCLAPAIISWFLVIIIWILWGQRLEWLDGLWCELKPNSWPLRTWYKNWKGTTFVLGGFYAPGWLGQPGTLDTRIEKHEHKHIVQSKAASLLGLLVGIIILIVGGFSAYLVALLAWSACPFLLYLCAGITAKVYGKSFYRGNFLEEHAYSKEED